MEPPSPGPSDSGPDRHRSARDQAHAVPIPSSWTAPIRRVRSTGSSGTGLCERFGFELKGTSFLAHWESQSGLSLAPLLRQALRLGQPVCLSSVAATIDNGMAELETILTPVSFNGGPATRFFGMVQVLSDPTRCSAAPSPMSA